LFADGDAFPSLQSPSLHLHRKQGSDMTKGIFRSGDDSARVDYGRHAVTIPREEYSVNEYEPPFHTLATKEEFEAAAAAG
jgi:hypothetical protein